MDRHQYHRRGWDDHDRNGPGDDRNFDRPRGDDRPQPDGGYRVGERGPDERRHPDERHRSDDRDRYAEDRYRERAGRGYDDRRYADHGHMGSEVDADRDRGGGPRYHGAGWDRVEREPDARHDHRPQYDGYAVDRRRAQGDGSSADRQSRRYGEVPMDEGERRRYHGGWDRHDDRAWTGRGMGGDTYGGQDRGYDSLIPPAPEDRGRYDVGRHDMPSGYRGDDRSMRDRGGSEHRGGGSYGGEHAGMHRRR